MKIKAIALALALLVVLLSACGRNLVIPEVGSVAEELPPQDEQVIHPLYPPVEPSSQPSEPQPSLTPLPMTVDYSALQSYPTTPVKWGPGTHKDSLGRSLACVDLQKKYGDMGAHFIGSDNEMITLTFDQGYENGYTAAILDTLKEKNVQAIFFITGDYFRRETELIQRMIDEGHIIGSHSNKHIDFSTQPAEKCYEDILWLHEQMKEQFAYEMRLFRYPSGTFNEQSLALMQQVGYEPVFWSFGYADWDPNKQMSPEAAMTKIKEYLHPGEIMLLHSVGETNSLILDELIDYIRDQGYTIAPYPELLD